MSGPEGAAQIPAGPGNLVAVVGPSGAGKDTLIDAARRHLAHDPGFVFPRRIVTRPAQGGIEVHVPVSDIEFQQMAADGAFCLHWQAHGLRYAIPGSVEDAIAQGRTVIVNLSRAMINAAGARFRRMIIINVTAPRAALLARLAARDRATDGDLAKRVDRSAVLPRGDFVEIVNDGPVEDSISMFLDVIKAAPEA